MKYKTFKELSLVDTIYYVNYKHDLKIHICDVCTLEEQWCTKDKSPHIKNMNIKIQKHNNKKHFECTEFVPKNTTIYHNDTSKVYISTNINEIKEILEKVKQDKLKHIDSLSFDLINKKQEIIETKFK